MSRALRRIVVAACLSGAGFAITFAWYFFSGQRAAEERGATPIARLNSASGGVQRKPARRLIWLPISTSESLYAGESIRTGSSGEAHVEFIKSQTRIELEPDSVVVLEESAQGLKANILKGNFFVAATESADASSLTIRSGDKEFKVKGSELAISTGADGRLDVQVIKGSSTLSALADKEAQIQILKPDFKDILFVDPTSAPSIPIEFQALPPGYQVFVELGKSRRELKPLNESESPGPSGKIKATFPVGRVYWRLVARAPAGGKPNLTSSVFQNTVRSRSPPILLSPAHQASVQLKAAKPTVELAWLNPAKLEALRLEVFKGRDFKAPYVSMSVADTGSYALELPAAGSYTWRLSGTLSGQQEVVASPLRAFTASLLAERELAQPVLSEPQALEEVAIEQLAASGLQFTWKQVPGAARYHLHTRKLNSEPAQKHESAQPRLTLTTLKPGTYSWYVVAVAATGEVSRASEERRFTVREVENLRWADGNNEENFYFHEAQAKVPLRWEKTARAASWRVRLWRAREPASESPWLTRDEPSAELQLPGAGVFWVEAEALDKNGEHLGRTPKRKISATELALLPPPQFDPKLGRELSAQNDGSARLAWLAVEGASEYVLDLVHSETGAKSEMKFKRIEAALEKLLPGTYRVSLRTLDQHGRLGPAGEVRELKVPATSNVRAPKLKTFKVE